jgi:putative tryptophan/tyrosine transport system substrate-binding protein
MRRRAFLLGGLAAGAISWPLASHAQSGPVPLIGVLSTQAAGVAAPSVAAFSHGLREGGFIEGRDVAIEHRWAAGLYDRLPALAKDLVDRPVHLLIAVGGTVSARAAQAATSTIPIVFVIGGDPVATGLVSSLSRPGGNVTGISMHAVALGPKLLGLLSDLVPADAAIAMLVNPENHDSEIETNDVLAAARSLGRRISILQATSEEDFHPIFAALAEQRVPALLLGNDPLFILRRDKIIALAARHRVPTIYRYREFVEAGGLISYGSEIASAHRQAGLYAGRILKGAKPAELPVVQPTKFELVVNLRTARALGLEIPDSLLARADEVIE